MRRRGTRGKLKRRLVAVALGALLAAGALELSLQAAGLVLRASDSERAEHDGQLHERRVLCLGACYTVGVGSPPELSYPSQLEELLEAGGYPVSVINGGVRGKSVAWFARYIDQMLREAKPEILIVNVNDRLVFSAQTLASAEAAGGAGSRKLKRLLNHSLLYKAVSLALAEPPPQTGLPPEWWGVGCDAPDGRDYLAHRIQELEKVAAERPDDESVWTELAAQRAERLDYEGALEAASRAIAIRGEASGELLRALLDYNIALRRYAEAVRVMERLREDEVYRATFEGKVAEWEATSYSMLGRLRYQIDYAEYLAIYGDLEEAVRLSEEVNEAMPGKVTASDRLDFYRALAEAGDEPLPEQAPIRTEALFSKDELELTGSGRLGIFEENEDPGKLSDPEEAARYYRLALTASLQTVLAAADPLGVHVVIENLSSLPEQQPIIREVCDELGLTLVDLQSALAAHPRRDELLHPQQNLRLSPAGNRFIAETLYQTLQDEGLL
jgi:tetratricopeptide (TPR) repeat protein